MPDKPEDKTMTNAKIMEAQSKVEVSVPPRLDDTSVNVTLDEDKAFMESATPEQLELLRNLTEADILNDAIIAIDIKVPNFLDVKLKDPLYVPRWVNRKYDGEGGNRYEQMLAVGFVNVTPDEVDGPLGKHLLAQDGGITNGDLILMKMHKARLYGIYKKNIQRANQIHNRTNVQKEALAAGQQELRSQLGTTGVSQSVYAGKLSMFIPDKIPGEL